MAAGADIGLEPAAPAARWRALAPRVLGFSVAFYVLCRLGDELSVQQSDFSTWWPASGLFLAALLVSPSRDWGALVGGAALASVAAGLAFGRTPFMMAVTIATDAGDALVAAALVRRATAGRAPLATVRGALALVLVGALLAPMLGALAGAGATVWRYGAGGLDFWKVWREWWAGDGLGVLAVCPLVLAWTAPGGAPHDRPARLARAAEAAALAATLVLSARLVFAGGLHLDRSHLVLPPLVWAAVRFGTRGASAGATLVAIVAAWATSRGPIAAPGGLALASAEVQFLLDVAVATALLLAVALEERGRALAALRESEAQFEAFVRHSPAVLAVKDAEGRLLTASAGLARALGAAPAGRAPDGSGAPRGTGPGLDEAEGRVLESGKDLRAEEQTGDRTLATVKFRIPREGRPPLLGAVGVDVTEQRRAERALRLAQTALDRGHAAVLILDPEGRVGYANEAAQRLFDRAAAELVGRAVWEVDGAFEESAWPARWRELRERGGVELAGAPRRGRTGRLDAEIGLSHLAFDGEEYAIYAARDLTDRRRAEVAERLASVGTLAAGMAHEINNPLTFVTANLAWARDALRGLDGDPRLRDAARALDDAAEGTRRVSKVVRDLRSVSRPADRTSAPIDVAAEVVGGLKLVQHEVRHRARVVTALAPAPPVLASEFQLGQVIVNLVVNAAHAIPEGAADRHEIRVATGTSADGWAMVEVSDTGAGIPEEVRARIFEPFFTTKPAGQGTGLGLSVCHGIVTALGGRIEVESAPGEGALFRVLLPPASAATVAGEPAAAPGPERRARILVVDDEPIIGSTIRRILAGAHDVEATTDPRGALARLSGGERFDLVLCDLMMPDLTGMDLHEALARANPDAARRVAFITGGAFTERARSFLERCALPHIAKPFSPEPLRETVRALLEGAPVPLEH